MRRGPHQSTFLGPGRSFGKQLGIFKTTQKMEGFFFPIFFVITPLPHPRVPRSRAELQRSPAGVLRASIIFFCPGIT